MTETLSGTFFGTCHMKRLMSCLMPRTGPTSGSCPRTLQTPRPIGIQWELFVGRPLPPGRYEVKARFSCARVREMAARVYLVRDGIIEFENVIRGKDAVTGYTNSFSLETASVLDFVAGPETNWTDWTGIQATIKALGPAR